MKANLMVVAPLFLLAACRASVPSTGPATPPAVPAVEQIASELPTAKQMDVSAAADKAESAPPVATASEQQSKANPDEKERVFLDRRSVEAMDRLAISVPVQHTSRGVTMTLPSDDTFEPGTATPTLSAQWQLGQIASALAAQSNRKIHVDVYTDSLGDADERQALSQLRADTLRSYFVSRGANADAIDARGRGSARAVASNSTVEGRRNNHRIEIVVERTAP